MKTLFICTLFFSSWLTCSAATLAQTRFRVDNWLTNRWPTIVQRQTNYFNSHGNYWQGLITHSNVPAHTTTITNDTVPTRWVSKPTDQNSSWLTAFPEWQNEAVSASLRCDVYKGPQGAGFVATVFVRFNGTLYSRSQNFGPETFRTFDWFAVPLNLTTNMP